MRLIEQRLQLFQAHAVETQVKRLAHIRCCGALLLCGWALPAAGQSIDATTYPFTFGSGAALEDMASGTTQLVGPDLDRPFRTPWVPVVPILGVVFCVGLMATLPADTWIRLLVWLLIGFVIYFGYSRKHSRLQRELEGGGGAGSSGAGFGGGTRGQPRR